MTDEFVRVDGRSVPVDDPDATLLDVLRAAGFTSVKDGCAPQGQCGCCTVWLDGQARVSCVTPVRRAMGREVTTIDGVDPELRAAWVGAVTAAGASQCGFCTPGILMRLMAASSHDAASVARGLAAHLCRCTGWQTLVEAAAAVERGDPVPADRDWAAAAERAAIEGGIAQQVGPAVALGRGGFADDLAPSESLVALRSSTGAWVTGRSLPEARRASGKVQGRRTTLAGRPPVDLPPGDWALTLQTSWVEPAYLEPDASWAAPGGSPASAAGNGGAFGGKTDSPVGQAAVDLSASAGHPVRALWTREDVARFGPKRPPLAIGVTSSDGGVVRVARTAGVSSAVGSVAPDWSVEEVDVVGPATSVSLRGAGWMEAQIVLAALAHGGRTGGRLVDVPVSVTVPGGGQAVVSLGPSGVDVRVAGGRVLDEVVLRSYAIGAVHQALSWVWSERLTVDDDGEVLDLTIRSFGILKASEMPTVRVTIDAEDGPPVNASDAVLVAAAAAAWLATGCAPVWPTGRPVLAMET